MEDQIRLVNFAKSINNKVLISNSYCDETIELYNDADDILFKDIGRSIGGDRKSVKEILVIYNKVN